MAAEAQAINSAYGQSVRARAFVTEMHEKCKLDDPASRHMAERMAEILDELEECKSIMCATGGPFYKDRFGKPRLHPAALREVALTNEFGKMYRLLGLDQPLPEQGSFF
jgi:hypothetical protein